MRQEAKASLKTRNSKLHRHLFALLVLGVLYMLGISGVNPDGSLFNTSNGSVPVPSSESNKIATNVTTEADVKIPKKIVTERPLSNSSFLVTEDDLWLDMGRWFLEASARHVLPAVLRAWGQAAGAGALGNPQLQAR